MFMNYCCISSCNRRLIRWKTINIRYEHRNCVFRSIVFKHTTFQVINLKLEGFLIFNFPVMNNPNIYIIRRFQRPCRNNAFFIISLATKRHICRMVRHIYIINACIKATTGCVSSLCRRECIAILKRYRHLGCFIQLYVQRCCSWTRWWQIRFIKLRVHSHVQSNQGGIKRNITEIPCKWRPELQVLSD